MAISSFDGQKVKYVPSSSKVNANILDPGTWIKTIGHFSFSHFKSRRKESDLCFFIHGPGGKILASSPLDDATYSTSRASKNEMATSRLLGHGSKK